MMDRFMVNSDPMIKKEKKKLIKDYDLNMAKKTRQQQRC